MGCFSWCYAEKGMRTVGMKIYMPINSYLLVPKPFQSEYGKYIVCGCYDGYGNIGSYDIYELVAIWNQDYVTEKKLIKFLGNIPEKDRYMGLYDFEKESMRKNGASEEEIERADEEKKDSYYKNALIRYENKRSYLYDFFVNKLSVEELIIKYKNDEILREIGIDIAAENKCARLLKNPIKITTKPMDYDEVQYSLKDDRQGF